MSKRKKNLPNAWDCEGCEDWDDVNGCWADCEEYCGKETDREDEF